MVKNKVLLKKIFIFIIGLFVMSFGVSLSVKADLGVSAISCVPYVYSLKLPLTLGEITILLNILFVIAQIAILRKDYKIVQLVQLPAVIVFGYCIDFTMFALSNLKPTSYIEQAALSLSACAVLAFGVFLLLKTRLTYLPLDGLVITISQAYKKEFGKVKISMDSSMVVFGVISSFLLLGNLEGIREGTVAAALLVGGLIKFFNAKIFFIDKWIAQEVEQKTTLQKAQVQEQDMPLVITIAREYGSGGHEIGQYIAKELGIDFYDKQLIELTAQQTGYTPEYIQENEQSLSDSLLYELYEQNFAYVNDELPPSDVLFLVQSKIIRDICAQKPCVIVGRCANFILKDNPNCFNIFVHANYEYREDKINKQYKANPPKTDKDLEMMDKKRESYCLHHTRKDWKDVRNYHVSIDSSLYGSQEAAKKVVELVKNFAKVA